MKSLFKGLLLASCLVQVTQVAQAQMWKGLFGNEKEQPSSQNQNPQSQQQQGGGLFNSFYNMLPSFLGGNSNPPQNQQHPSYLQPDPNGLIMINPDTLQSIQPAQQNPSLQEEYEVIGLDESDQQNSQQEQEEVVTFLEEPLNLNVQHFSQQPQQNPQEQGSNQQEEEQIQQQQLPQNNVQEENPDEANNGGEHSSGEQHQQNVPPQEEEAPQQQQDSLYTPDGDSAAQQQQTSTSGNQQEEAPQSQDTPGDTPDGDSAAQQQQPYSTASRRRHLNLRILQMEKPKREMPTSRNCCNKRPQETRH